MTGKWGGWCLLNFGVQRTKNNVSKKTCRISSSLSKQSFIANAQVQRSVFGLFKPQCDKQVHSLTKLNVGSQSD